MSKKRFNRQQLILSILMGMVAIPLGFIGAISFLRPSLLERFFNGPISLIFLFPTIIISIFLMIFLHELGHVVGGKIADFYFVMFTVGPFKFFRKQKGIGFEINRSAAGFGGLTVSIPKTGKFENASIISYITGGLVANGATVIVCTTLLIIFRYSIPPDLNVFIFTLGYFSLLALIQNGIPISVKGMMNDGKQFSIFIKGGERAEFRKTLFTLASYSMAGYRPSNLPEDIIEYIKDATLNDPVEEYSVKTVLYEVALDKRDLNEARTIIEDLQFIKPEVPPFLQSNLEYENLFIRLLLDLPVDDFEDIMRRNQKLPSYFDPSIRLRVFSLHSLKKGHYDEAIGYAEEGIAKLVNHFNRGNGVMQKELLEEIIDLGKAGKKSDPQNQVSASPIQF